MQFDVIIGNPPYHRRDGGHGASAMSLFHLFVRQAIKLQPRYLTMIIPSRWFAGGRGLDEFRREMLNDERIRKIVDFEDAREVFPWMDIAGGVCYFLWERDYKGPCEVVNVRGGVETASVRPLNEFDILIRHHQAIPIIRKVLARGEPTMDNQVSIEVPFGLRTYIKPQTSGDILLRWRGGEGPYSRKDIAVGVEMIDKWKVAVPSITYDSSCRPDEDGKRVVLSEIYILPPGTVCTETYLVVGAYDSPTEAENLAHYMRTKLFRFLLSQFGTSIHLTRRCYAFIPILDMSVRWTDEMLCQRYGITPEEFSFIESKIRDMPDDDGPQQAVEGKNE